MQRGFAAIDDTDEAGLVRLVAKGDQAAFERLYRRTAPWLTVRLLRRCGDGQLVAEVLQDTFVTVWRAAGAFAGSSTDGGAVGWLWTIAARRLVDGYRRRARLERPPAAYQPDVTVPAAEDEALAGEIDGHLGVALDALAPELRDVLRAMALDGLSVRETATLLGLPEGTVKTRVRRARIRMREAMIGEVAIREALS